MSSSEPSPYRMTITLSVLDELGINQYSNVPAVLAEAVANAWDADAKNVNIDMDKNKVVITDDGHGMTKNDINEKYLTVGYHRRESDEAETPKGRSVMGRKGIGKLSLFSIADCIQVHTTKNKEKNGFEMKASDIREAIQRSENNEYHPASIDFEGNSTGTKIVLTELKKRIKGKSIKGLKQRLARRFSIIDPSHEFEVVVDNSPISPEDRDYYHKIQYIWHYGEDGERYSDLCVNKEETGPRGASISVEGTDYEVSGWIGTVRNSGDVKSTDGSNEDLNRIVVIVRGKLAHENILPFVTGGGMYTKYIMGEIHANFLDRDDRDDIATGSRQNIKEDDPRFEELLKFVRNELNHIANEWTRFRNREGEEKAIENEAIAEWYGTLKGDTRKTAQKIFGAINSAPVEEEKRNDLFKMGVLAIERMKISGNLSGLDNISVENLAVLGEFFAQNDEIEASLYYEITSGRLKIIDQLAVQVDENAKERVIQEHIFDHLWLLDPSWDRATADARIEQRVTTEFRKVTENLTGEEIRARIDIRYTSTAGKHVIVELKRPSAVTSTETLSAQLKKYRDALKKVLESVGKDASVECVCIIGKALSDWDQRGGKEISIKQLEALSARIVTYDELINQAQIQYREYTEKQKEAGRILDLIKKIGADFQQPSLDETEKKTE